MALIVLQTSQIIEALDPHHTASSGLLIANDSDYKRTHMLVHQTGRMPSKGLIVTNLDAGKYSCNSTLLLHLSLYGSFHPEHQSGKQRDTLV